MELQNKFQLSRVTSKDFDEVVSLVNSAYRGDSSRLGWTTEAKYLDGQRIDLQILNEEVQNSNKSLFCLRAEDNLEIIGTVQLEKFEDDKGIGCYLGMLTVKPSLQNTGLGKWLMSQAETHAKEWGARRITLGVLNPRQELMAWYQRRGYRSTGQRESFPVNHDKFGYPKIKDLHFLMFEKTI